MAVELAKKVFRERYHCALSIEWESNKKHSKKSCMALVDEMAMAAWNGLKLGETVFAHVTHRGKSTMRAAATVADHIGGLACRYGRRPELLWLPIKHTQSVTHTRTHTHHP